MLSFVHGVLMVTKKVALLCQKNALRAITDLTAILFAIKEKCSDEDYQIIKRGVGLSIGRIQMELLEPIYRQHPEIDHLKD